MTGCLRLPWQLLQSVRFAHALLEVSTDYSIPAEAVPIFDHLVRAGAPLPPRRIAGEDEPAADVSIDHSLPFCRWGSESQPLVFPRWVVDRYRSLWGRSRFLRASFVGLIGARAARAAVLRPWIGRDGVIVEDAGAGREWPGKAWDERYVSGMTSSEGGLGRGGGG